MMIGVVLAMECGGEGEGIKDDKERRGCLDININVIHKGKMTTLPSFEDLKRQKYPYINVT